MVEGWLAGGFNVASGSVPVTCEAGMRKTCVGEVMPDSSLT